MLSRYVEVINVVFSIEDKGVSELLLSDAASSEVQQPLADLERSNSIAIELEMMLLLYVVRDSC